MKILITGASGYIGSELCKMILEQIPSAEILAFDNLYYDQWRYTYNCFNNPRIVFYNQNILEWKDELISAVQSADFIICLAAIVGAPACDKVPELSTKINYEWYSELLSKLAGHQKVIYPNTNSGYGTTPHGTVCTEESATNPISLYGKLKEATEKYLLKNYKNTVCFRLATVFGLSARPRLDLLVNNLVYTSAKKNKLDIFDGHFRRNFISVNDVCRAFIFAIHNFDKMKQNVYNLGADSLNATKLEFATKVKELTGCELAEHHNKTDPDKRDYIVSSQKLYDTGFTIEDSTMDKSIKELHYFCKNIINTDGMFNY